MFVKYVYWFTHILYRSSMAGWGFSSGRGRGRLRKHSLPFCTQAPPTTSTASVFTTTIASIPPGCPLHGQEFVMIPNPKHMEPGSQPSFLPQSTPQPTPSPHPLARGEDRTWPVPSSIPSPTPSQPSSHAWCFGLIVHPLIELHEPARGAQIWS